ncbi:4-hydroxyacetophenone monooxygenase [Scedosporium apiospermum]|uniref:4-hydroxyacetophenone monooxygenase n=1 Tax=Pseudallescheria apiosperma TaxID=563466 RepID=A0A084G810_PSEDA|nr:4-hydroxyacetophenone monooxygenase [Scedosporium apiospermum]KEZ43472.1 4-hydroxyacetophenone monooxygenase [Scedosporium apiospermum]
MSLNTEPTFSTAETLPQPQVASLDPEFNSTGLARSEESESSKVPVSLPAAPSSSFQLLQQWHSQPRKLRIIHVGAGATGLCTAFKFERQLTDYELVCYEKNDEIGGTWLENRYPGCACDVPAHIYTYTFEPNPFWKSYYAGSPEIHDYFMHFCEKYQLRKYLKLKHRVLSAAWHEDKGQWAVEIEHDGNVFTDWCDILMNGSGLLNKYRWPEIEGLNTFKGTLVHSAKWDHSVDYSNKRVAVLGNGSSAIQIIPQLQEVASKVGCFMRGSTWIAAPMPRVPVELPSNTGEEIIRDKEAVRPSIGQYFYTPEEIKRLADDPDYLLNYRKRIEFAINEGFAIFYKDTEASRMAYQYMQAEMARGLENDPVLTKKLVPSWPVGCRRLTPGDGYLEALIKPNVECYFTEISSITEKGLNTTDGASHEVDAIVCATGYDMAWTPHFTLIGRDGVNIKDAWNPEPKCYLGLAAPGFPNYFVMNGPRGNLANGTVLPCLETEIDYVIKAAKKMQSDRIKVLDVRESVVDQLDEYIDAWHQTSVFSGSCRSWYKNNSVDGKPRVWGGSSVHFLKTIKTPRWEHYNIEYLDDNPWAFLGNGRIKAEVEHSFEGLTSYLRNSDCPWTIE